MVQTIVTNYYAEIDNIGFVKEYNGVGKWDKICSRHHRSLQMNILQTNI
jgi:hypothetical protein